MAHARGRLFGVGAASIVLLLLAAAACSSSYGATNESATSDGGGTSDGATTPTDATAAPPDGSLACASPLLVGPTDLPSFASHTGNGTLEQDGGWVHGFASLEAGTPGTAFVYRDFPTSTTSLVLDYDLVATVTSTIYAELGCSLTLKSATAAGVGTTLYPYANQGNLRFGVTDWDGGIVTSDLGTIPDGQVHVRLELDLTKTPGHVVGTLTVGPKIGVIDAPVASGSGIVGVACGLNYANGRSTGGKVDVAVDGVRARICP